MLKKHKAFLIYLFLGGCTTLVNVVVYYLCAHPLRLSTVVSTAIAWLLSVAFAYVTNKVWVFESRSWRGRLVLREGLSFLVCRAATGVFDCGFMVVMVDVLGFNDLCFKIVSNVIVVLANFFASKFLIFRR